MDPELPRDIARVGVGSLDGEHLNSASEKLDSEVKASTRTVSARQMAVILGVCKTSYLALLCTLLWFWADYNQSAPVSINERWFQSFDLSATDFQQGRLSRHFATWDAQHYLFLAKAGYAKEVPSRAFYPLWPMAVRTLSVLTGGNMLIAGMVLSNLFSLAAWVLFYSIVAPRFGGTVALWATILLVSFPGALFFQFVYTESLFFLLLMLLWWGLERQRLGIALFAAFLLPLTRSVGAFAVLPLAWYAMRQMPIFAHFMTRWSGGVIESEGEATSRSAVLTICLVLAPVFGFALYLTLMWFWTGNPFAGIEAQKFWGAHALSNLWNVPKFVIGYISPTCWHGFHGSVLDRCGFALLLCLLPVIWRQGKDLVLWTVALGILPAMSGTFVSFTRFESVAFPVFIALAAFLTRLRRRWVAYLVLASFGLLHLILLWQFVNFRWAG